MKGIILVGGKGSRLYPITLATHKQLTPVYDKPMIYYPVSTLIESGIREILIITTKEYVNSYKKLLGDGSNMGVKFSFAYEEKSEGIANAFNIARNCGFLNDKEPVCLLLGDNLFMGNLKQQAKYAIENAEENGRSTVFALEVPDPQRFGVAEFDDEGKVLSLEEKPVHPKSNYAVTGLYFYTGDVVDYAKDLKPSDRGEYEITDINKIYLNNGKLDAQRVPSNVKWLDAGTVESLYEATSFVRDAYLNRNLSIGNPFIAAYRNGWISKSDLIAVGNELHTTEFGKYILKIAKEPNKGVLSR